MTKEDALFCAEIERDIKTIRALMPCLESLAIKRILHGMFDEYNAFRKVMEYEPEQSAGIQ